MNETHWQMIAGTLYAIGYIHEVWLGGDFDESDDDDDVIHPVTRIYGLLEAVVWPALALIRVFMWRNS